MYIQFQSPGIGSFTTNDFDDQKKFLDSLATGNSFKVFEQTTTNEVTDISFKKVIKKLRIESVKPLNKEAGSFYLEFTAKDSEDETISYTGMICWN